MAYPEFVEPRRECTARIPETGRTCGSHVIARRGRWYCPTCGEMRSMATTTEVLGAPPKPRHTTQGAP